ncbi:hypothetical protein CRG98_036477 [Punica granatum]|uniref:Uncharacterized protein n=1 Tax=Punica granatum TaxID=22663 RepID=A0A2I0IGK6_PUNGR|nr:hypothetical protein CRG98_036477 [Punica granatum]
MAIAHGISLDALYVLVTVQDMVDPRAPEARMVEAKVICELGNEVTEQGVEEEEKYQDPLKNCINKRRKRDKWKLGETERVEERRGNARGRGRTIEVTQVRSETVRLSRGRGRGYAEGKRPEGRRWRLDLLWSLEAALQHKEGKD